MRRSTVARIRVNIVLTLSFITGPGCAPGAHDRSDSTAVSVDTLPDGIVQVTYPSLPNTPSKTLTPDLRIGSVEGDVTFGDIKGLGVDLDGTLLVLDDHASELQRFDTLGTKLEVVMTRGEGPYEISHANGLFVDDDGSYWIYDYGKVRITRLLPDRRVETFQSFVPGYGYVWDGGVSADGRIWTAWMQEAQMRGSTPGLLEGRTTRYYKHFDPSSGAVDSVITGSNTWRTLTWQDGGSSAPFAISRVQALAPDASVWTAGTDVYHLTRLGTDGDTAVVVEVNLAPPRVSAEERREQRDRIERSMESRGRFPIDWDDVIPETKPILDLLATDPQGNVWVLRQTTTEQVFEQFSTEGMFLQRLSLDHPVRRYVRPVFQRGWLLTVQVDSLGVQSVVGYRFPG